MKRNFSIQLKAAFLLIVFALNTAVGFACSVGMDMGFNTAHHSHNEAEEAPVHVHSGGEKHQHHKATPKHHHDKKDNCCTGQVIQFQHLDKSFQSNTVAIGVPAFTVNHSCFFCFGFHKEPLVTVQNRIVRFMHPPPDLRIFIRSFQI